MPKVHTPTRQELDGRVSRFGQLREMTTRSTELAGISREAVDSIFARKIMPVIPDGTKNPFGSYLPIVGAARIAMLRLGSAARRRARAVSDRIVGTTGTNCWRRSIFRPPSMRCFVRRMRVIAHYPQHVGAENQRGSAED